MGLAERLRNEGNVDKAIEECIVATEWAVKNNSFEREMQARNLLASLYWSKEALCEALSQYGKVIGIGRKCGIIQNKVYTEALYHTVVILTRIQPPPPQMFLLAEELVKVRSSIANDENDKELQDYKLILDTLKKVYKRRHRLRKPKEYTITIIIGTVNN